MFRKVLIANRGEIACRIARGLRDSGIASVAVYSEADRDGLHVRLADEAYLIGPAASSESYLSMAAILDAAKKSGAEAVHPGYGFLAENASFAEACRERGLVFVGPPPSAVALMGDKARARAVAVAAGVPVVAGTLPLDSLDEATREADRIGYPLLVKATAGGGGKGMRRVSAAPELSSAFEQARSEAQSSFGDPSVYLEKYVERPRHVEIQVLGDRFGSMVHLFERECSIQRRHQKLIEEAPSPFLDEDLRARMGEAAVSLASSAGYENAGTVEFLVDAKRSFYFLEMNARLQVEHPVTELVTGLDLVQLQLAIASGSPLPFSQSDLTRRGWAMEFRITAEDPFQNFMPTAGTLSVFRPPEGPGIRNDAGVFQGQRVTPHYDPLIAKLIVGAGNRAQCIARARRAIREYRVLGVSTTLPFFERMLSDERFLSGEMDVGFVDRHWMSEMASERVESKDLLPAALAAAAAALEDRDPSTESSSEDSREPRSSWKLAHLLRGRW
ncbi:MAG TPA: acetyl-CoA carboxylase biotin carboxylase subunit [Vicinamibacteria bacterium]|nr:acetyl-CoA carboxylase biotin carboxylase subunit [Vicinamibacteria bacterium]